MENIKCDEKLREMQLKIFDVLCEIDHICKKNNIKYSLWAGSIIGAIVHKGFIPWDDDIDLVMDRENFDKFKKVCSEKLSLHLEYKDYFTDNNSFVLIAKIIDKSTTCIMSNQYGEKFSSGIFVDITVLDYIPKLAIKANIQYIVSRISLLYVNKHTPENHGNIIRFLGNLVLKSTPRKLYTPIVKLCYKYITSFDKSCCNYVDQIIYPSERINLDLNTLDEFIEVNFEGREFPVFKDYHNYLMKRYKRDYMTLPPIEERKPHHNIEYFNCK